MPIGILESRGKSSKFRLGQGKKGRVMIQMAAKCPNCGANHNPLGHPSLRCDADSQVSDEFPPPPSTIAYTWLCESCGETYRLDVACDGQ